jgi:hypothetical protein
MPRPYRKIIYSDCPSLYPAQIPAIPPRDENKNDHQENIPAPHNPGMNPPILEPTKKPNQTNFLVIEFSQTNPAVYFEPLMCLNYLRVLYSSTYHLK